ncbi:transmembrane protein, putative (macronuclear) [Tetrahymena thermophila SB210]|uniref:Transmembrane protein, putative n=1 Tax=Tetrahymena thermophila (strain SB210) TaxID=312017 RepID=Q22MT9_TETTS|nr:transmembrane protein, putative [Tetrahymena thermophila SB210]EAR86353.2 transmembrane protein, putative [Tetrahymena thermophila SB210]|eukprot:XP_976931.2 transmembrane protein, putative [Tetrahymena thermophila SB210]
MKQQKLVLAFFILATCFSVMKAQNGDEQDIFLQLIKTQIKSVIESPDFQYNFIQGFTKQFIFGQIKLYDLAVNHSKQIGSDQAKKIKEEIDGLVGILFQGRFSTLQDLVEDIKKNDPTSLNNIFSKTTFNEDLKHFNYQDQLAQAIANKLIDKNQSPKEKLTQSIKNLDLIKKFLIQYRGVKEEDAEKAFSYIKDSNKLKKTMLFASEKLSDPKIAGSLMKLALKFNDAQRNGNATDIISLIQDDKALLSLLADQDWGDLLKLKDELTKIGGKAYEDYLKNGGGSRDRDNDDNDDDDEEEEDLEGGKKKHSSMGFGKIFLIILGVVSVIAIAFLIYRKYNQSKYNDGSYTENKQLYRPTV